MQVCGILWVRHLESSPRRRPFDSFIVFSNRARAQLERQLDSELEKTVARLFLPAGRLCHFHDASQSGRIWRHFSTADQFRIRSMAAGLHWPVQVSPGKLLEKDKRRDETDLEAQRGEFCQPSASKSRKFMNCCAIMTFIVIVSVACAGAISRLCGCGISWTTLFLCWPAASRPLRTRKGKLFTLLQ